MVSSRRNDALRNRPEPITFCDQEKRALPKSTARTRAAKAGKAKSAVAGRHLAAAAKPVGGKAQSSALAAASQLQAAIHAGNARAADKHLARDFTFIDAAGQVHSRRSVLNALKSSPRST